MSRMEKLFYDLLENLFIGVELEGNSGYINLMNARYKFYKKVIVPAINKSIEKFRQDAASKLGKNPDEVEFLENAMYDLLYTFYSRYFTGSSIYYNNIHPSNPAIVEPYSRQQTLTGINVDKMQYETFDTTNDVVLFWKTKDLYYIKTDKTWHSTDVEIEKDGKKYIFSFDVSLLEHKKGNEKMKGPKYEIVKCNGNRFYFAVVNGQKSEKMYQNIASKIKKANCLGKNQYNDIIDLVKKAIFKFEKQGEIDYFIHKNARAFLDNELRLFIADALSQSEEPLNDVLNPESQLVWQYIRYIGSLINYLVGMFEDELVRMWNKPRFVKNSHYVITLDRIWKKGEKGKEVVKEIVEYLKGQEGQFKEEVAKIGTLDKKIRERYEKALDIGYSTLLTDWYVLGIIDADFDINNVLEVKTGKGMLEEKIEELNPKWQFLPVDTRFLPEKLEYKILSLFDNLDDALDGWLIHSENYQALNTILPKWKEKVQTIYIDPPFNLEKNADFLYSVNYKDSTWITMLENRIRLARDLINERGSMFVRCDYNGNMYVRMLMNEIFGEENFRNEIVVRRGSPKAGLFQQFNNLKSIGVMYDNIYWYSRNMGSVYGNFIIHLSEKKKGYWTSFKKVYDRPTMRYEILGINLERGQWMWNKKRAYLAVENYKKYLEVSKETGESLEDYWKRTGKQLEFVRRHGNSIQYWVPPKEKTLLDNNWTDISGYSQTTGFSTENSEVLLKRVIQSTSTPGDLVIDFFLGSGTTTAVAHKLGRKWIGMEMGSHFYTVDLPRMKKVLFYDKSGISKEKDVKKHYNKDKAGGFFKYYELEQFEEILRRVKYNPEFVVPSEATLNAPIVGWLETDIAGTFNFMSKSIFIFQDKLLDYVHITENGIKFIIDHPQATTKSREKLDKIDIAETLSNLTGWKIKRIEKDDKGKLRIVFENNKIITYPFTHKDFDKFNLSQLVTWK